MKFSITSEAFEKLSDDLKGEYKKDGDGYKLKLDGLDLSELDDLKDSVKRLEDNNKQLLKEKKDAQKKADEDARKAAEASGDVEALKEAHRKELESLKSEYDGKLSDRDKSIESLTTGSLATQIASELAVEGSASTLSKLIRDRMRTTFVDGQPKTIILDANGNESEMTVDQLRDEIRADKALSPLISGSKGNGAGNGATSGGGSTGYKAAKDMTGKEKSAFISEHGLDKWHSKIRSEIRGNA